MFGFVSALALAQAQSVHGQLKDQETGEIVIGSHIRNLATGKATTSNHEGFFTLSVEEGDTLLFSHIGYQQLGWVAKRDWFEQERVEFHMQPDTIMLPEVVIGKLPTYDHFKQLIIDTQPADTTFEIFGLAAIPMNVSPAVTEADMQRSTGPTIGFRFDTDALTKKGKEKKELTKLLERKGLLQKAHSKFNRAWVAEETRLEGDQLTSFIVYCNFSPEYLAETTLFVIHEKMMAKLIDFMAEFSEG